MIDQNVVAAPCLRSFDNNICLPFNFVDPKKPPDHRCLKYTIITIILYPIGYESVYFKMGKWKFHFEVLQWSQPKTSFLFLDLKKSKQNSVPLIFDCYFYAQELIEIFGEAFVY